MSRARATSLVAAIRANVPVMALLGGPTPSAKLEAAIRELATAQIGFVRIGNPLVSPLSLERLVLQITDDQGGEGQDDAERVLRALIARSEMRRQVVVVVEQAETLTQDALEFLHALPGLSHPSLAPVQVALVGDKTLGPRIADNRTYIIRDPANPVPDPAELLPTIALEIPAPKLDAALSRQGRPRSEVLFLAGLAVCAVVAVVFMFHGPFPSDTIPVRPVPAHTLEAVTPPIASVQPPIAPAAPQVLATAPLVPPAEPQPTGLVPPAEPQPPEPRPGLALTSSQAPPAELPLPEPPVPPLAPPPDEAGAARARLYREFTAFLGTNSLGRGLSPAERETLLQDYLARHQSKTTASPTQSPAESEMARIPGAPRVLLFFAADSDPDHAAAEQQAELLVDRVAGLELQAAPTVPTVPTIRYEYAVDRPAALALAEAVWTPGGEWQVEDMTASPKRPEAGTIEMWLPRR